jgi:hypothetical protein
MAIFTRDDDSSVILKVARLAREAARMRSSQSRAPLPNLPDP